MTTTNSEDLPPINMEEMTFNCVEDDDEPIVDNKDTVTTAATSKLLSDEELYDELEKVVWSAQNEEYKGDWNKFTEKLSSYITLINAQKRLYAENVLQRLERNER